MGLRTLHVSDYLYRWLFALFRWISNSSVKLKYNVPLSFVLETKKMMISCYMVLLN